MMPRTGREVFTVVGAIAILFVTTVGTSGGTAYAQDDAARNSQHNPYRTIENWAKLPEGRPWGSTAGVDVDRHGNIWVAERCGANTCAGSNLPPILEFDPSGKLLKSFGEGMFLFPHGLTVDKDGNIWVTDGQGATGKGQQVFKFSPDGKVLMTLGKAGVAADRPDTFNMPSAVAIGSREFDIPHCLAFDSKGRLFVGDRNNNRIQIFDQEGNYIAEWKQFSRPSGISIDKHDIIYVADSESESVSKNHYGWKRGIRVGNVKDGSVTAFIADPVEVATGTSAAEGIAVDSKGTIYGAEVGPKDLKKYVKK